MLSPLKCGEKRGILNQIALPPQAGAQHRSEGRHLAVQKIELDVRTMQDLFGVGDTNIKLLERELGVAVVTRDGCIEVQGEDETRV